MKGVINMNDIIQEYLNNNKYIEPDKLSEHIEEWLDQMEILEEVEANDWHITKVPNGWIFNQLSNPSYGMVFVPERSNK
jgi:hypothetical protein